MHADLVRPPGFKAKAQQRMPIARPLEAVMRHGALPVCADGAARPLAKARDGRVDDAALLRRNAVGHGEVFADEAAGMQLRGQQALRVCMARSCIPAASSANTSP